MMIRSLTILSLAIAALFAALVGLPSNQTVPVSVHVDGRIFEGTIRDSGPLRVTLSYKGGAEHYFIRESGEYIYLLSENVDGYCFQMENKNTLLQMPKGSSACRRNS